MDEISIIETLIEEKLNGQFSHVDEIPNEKYNLDEKSDFWLKHPDKLVCITFYYYSKHYFKYQKIK